MEITRQDDQGQRTRQGLHPYQGEVWTETFTGGVLFNITAPPVTTSSSAFRLIDTHGRLGRHGCLLR